MRRGYAEMSHSEQDPLTEPLSKLGNLLNILTKDDLSEEEKSTKLEREINKLPNNMRINTVKGVRNVVDFAKKVSEYNDRGRYDFLRLFLELTKKIGRISLTRENYYILRNAIEEVSIGGNYIDLFDRFSVNETGYWKSFIQGIKSQHEKIVAIGLLRGSASGLSHSQIVSVIFEEFKGGNRTTANSLCYRFRRIQPTRNSLDLNDLKKILQLVEVTKERGLNSTAVSYLLSYSGPIKEPTEETAGEIANVIAEIVKKNKLIGWDLIDKINVIDSDNPDSTNHPFVLAVERNNLLENREKMLILSKLLRQQECLLILRRAGMNLPVTQEIIYDLRIMSGYIQNKETSWRKPFYKFLAERLEFEKSMEEDIMNIIAKEESVPTLRFIISLFGESEEIFKAAVQKIVSLTSPDELRKVLQKYSTWSTL